MMESPDRTAVPPVKPFGRMSVPDETVEILPNGLTLHSISGGDQPICKLSIAFGGGTSELGSDVYANLVLSQIIEGSKKKSAAEIADILDYNGARVGVRPQTHHCVLDVWALNERLPQILELLQECLAEPLYPESELEAAKLRTKAAFLSSREDVSVMAGEAFNKLIYGEDHPLAQPLSEQLIDAVNSEALHTKHRELLVPKTAHAFLSGMIDENVSGCVKRFLNGLPSLGHPRSMEVNVIRPQAPGTRSVVTVKNAVQDAVVVGLPTPGRESEDYSSLRLTVMALGGYFGSRLMANIREDKGLTYGIYSSLLGCHEGAYMSVTAQCDSAYTSRVIDEIVAEINSLASNPPRGEELRRLKLFASTSLAEILDTPAGIMGYYAGRLLVGTPADYFARQQAAIESLTPDVISEMASKYIRAEQLRIAVCGNY